MLRYFLLLILIIIVGRLFWRVVDAIIEGMRGSQPATRAPLESTAMVRDPICGTFVVPERSVALMDGRTQVHFCSADCRDTYRARQARRA